MAALAAMAGKAIIVNGPFGGAESTVEELRETVDALGSRMRHVLNSSNSILGRATGRDLTQAEEANLDRLDNQFADIERELKAARAELATAEAENEASTPLPRKAAPNPIASATPGARPRTVRKPIGERTPAFNDVFAGHDLADPYAGRFESFGEFALAVAMGGRDSRLIQNATMTTEEGATGGFLVPLQYLGSILDASLQQEVIRPRANVVPMVSKQAAAAVFDYADGTSGKRAGLQLKWGPEAGSMTEQRGIVREVGLKAHKANIYCRVSAELAADVPMFDRQLGSAIVAATAAGLDIAFLHGTGAGQPLGLVAGPNTVSVAKETSQVAATIYLQNLAKMMARLSPASFARSVWLIHPTCVVPLYTMSVVVQNVAATENVGGSTAAAITVDASGQFRIFGRPAIVSDACSVLGTVGDVILCDLSKYLIGMRAEAIIQKDTSVYFDTDEIAFKMTLRVDGMPADKEATKLRDGTNTVSPFVTLATRA